MRGQFCRYVEKEGHSSNPTITSKVTMKVYILRDSHPLEGTLFFLKETGVGINLI